ncbi:MAG: tetratricopeptide repeat protein [Spirochaetaceae bacterium]|jgi:tetratricopeptide (TPR) repeat protein|nr:tetratricopeptide repeat protein [Spirochaetaceae bacterium]
MFKTRSWSDYDRRTRRNQRVKRGVIIIFLSILIVSGGVFFWSRRSSLGNNRKEILRLWEEASYEDVFRITQDKLQTNPLDYFLLTIHGMVSYQLAVAQINNYDTLGYIDRCIWSLRKTFLINGEAKDGRIFYVLGKAYYEKGAGYTDLAVKFLEAARKVSYDAWDIPEYLGLAYAGIHDYHNSVAAFSLALNPANDTERKVENNGRDPAIAVYPQDLLLLAIARSYLELDESDTAKAYLLRCIETSRDSHVVITARFLLGGLLENSDDKEGAIAQYLTIIEESGENAEAHYRLGELYASMGDTTRSRFEWRTAIRLDPTHKQARIRLNL